MTTEAQQRRLKRVEEMILALVNDQAALEASNERGKKNNTNPINRPEDSFRAFSGGFNQRASNMSTKEKTKKSQV